MHISTLEKKKKKKRKKTALPDSNYGRRGLRDSGLPATPLFFLYIQGEIGMYTYVRIDAWYTLTKKRKQHPPPGDDASTAEAVSGRVGRDEQGVRQANTTPTGGPHLELGR